MTVRRNRQALRMWNNELRIATLRPETDAFFRRIHIEIDALMRHMRLFQ
jgi:hypothetical protein